MEDFPVDFAGDIFGNSCKKFKFEIPKIDFLEGKEACGPMPPSLKFLKKRAESADIDWAKILSWRDQQILSGSGTIISSDQKKIIAFLQSIDDSEFFELRRHQTRCIWQAHERSQELNTKKLSACDKSVRNILEKDFNKSNYQKCDNKSSWVKNPVLMAWVSLSAGWSKSWSFWGQFWSGWNAIGEDKDWGFWDASEFPKEAESPPPFSGLRSTNFDWIGPREAKRLYEENVRQKILSLFSLHFCFLKINISHDSFPKIGRFLISEHKH